MRRDTKPRVDVAALDALTTLLAERLRLSHYRTPQFPAHRQSLAMRFGEATMQCQRNARHDHRTRTTQFDLFAVPSGKAVPALGRVAALESKIATHGAATPVRTKKSPSSFAALA